MDSDSESEDENHLNLATKIGQITKRLNAQKDHKKASQTQ